MGELGVEATLKNVEAGHRIGFGPIQRSAPASQPARHHRGITVASLIPSSNVAAQRINDQTVLVDLRTNMVFTLNDTGGRTWELIMEGLDRDALLDQLEREFEVPRDQLECEVDSLLSHLSQEGLIEIE